MLAALKSEKVFKDDCMLPVLESEKEFEDDYMLAALNLVIERGLKLGLDNDYTVLVALKPINETVGVEVGSGE